MMILKRKELKVMKWFYGCFLILILAGTFYDYEITNLFQGNWTLFARVTEIFGEAPAMAALAVPFVIFAASNKRSTVYDYILLGIQTVFGLLFSFMVYFGIFRYLKPEGGNSRGEVTPTTLLIAVLLGGVTYFGLWRYFKNKEQEKLEKLKYAAKMMLLFAFTVVLLTNTVKIIVGRPRFWTIEDPTFEYLPWYKISGPVFSDDLMSFVSGHTSNAFIMISFAWMFFYETQWMEKVLYASLLWGTLVAAGRLFSGQHFLTDVAFAGILTVTLFLLFHHRMIKKYEGTV